MSQLTQVSSIVFAAWRLRVKFFASLYTISNVLLLDTSYLILLVLSTKSPLNTEEYLSFFRKK